MDNDICILVNDKDAKEKITRIQDQLFEFFDKCGIDNKVNIVESEPKIEIKETISNQRPKVEEVEVKPFNYQQANHYEVVKIKDLKEGLERVDRKSVV